MLRLSKLFIENWERRVGGTPTEASLKEILDQCKRVQSGDDFDLKDGSSFRMLGIYWHPELNLIIRIDETDKTAVTVITGNDGKRVGGRWKKNGVRKVAGYRRQSAIGNEQSAY